MCSVIGPQQIFNMRNQYKILAEKYLSEINTSDDQYEFDEVVEPAPEDKVDAKELEMGIEVEMEHTDSKEEAKHIALQHLAEDPHYYSKLKKARL